MQAQVKDRLRRLLDVAGERAERRALGSEIGQRGQFGEARTFDRGRKPRQEREQRAERDDGKSRGRGKARHQNLE